MISRLAFPALLILGTLPSFLPAQALQGRHDPEQLALSRNAVLAGKLPPFDTWPQPAAAVPDSEATTGSSDVEVALTGGGRVNGQDFWDQYLFRRGSDDPLVRWTVHAETKGQWGLLLHADYYSTTPGWQATNLILPDATSPFPMESHFLTQSWLWYDFHPLQIQIGRDQVHWGPLDNSLLVSDAVPFLDMIRGTIAGGAWTLDWIISTPETRTNGGGNDVLYVELLNLHRLEYRSDNWRWSFSEKYIVHRQPTGPFVLADYFPVGVFHNADVNPNNNCLNFDGEWVPAPGFRVMGQLGFDDVDGRILGIPDNPIPTIWAFLLGTEWQGTWDEAPVRLYGEAGMTHYLWGNFGDPTARALSLVALDRRTESVPLSAPYGPGTAWVNLSARWSRGPLSLSGKLELFDTKEGVTADTPYAYNWALEGFGLSPDERLSLAARWQFDPFWSLAFEPVQTYHQGTVGLEARATLDWKP